MWPWEHVIVGYLAYSLLSHLYFRDSPGGAETLAVGLASLLPDLIDKPLAWEFGVFESGYALGHSILFALPLSLAAGVLASRVGRGRAGIAFAIGYLLHLPGDVLYAYVRGQGIVDVGVVLWPLRRSRGVGYGAGLEEQVAVYLGEYRGELAAGDLSTYVLLQVGAGGLVLALWLYDGAPVLREGLRGGRRFGTWFRTAISGRKPSDRRQ